MHTNLIQRKNKLIQGDMLARYVGAKLKLETPQLIYFMSSLPNPRVKLIFYVDHCVRLKITFEKSGQLNLNICHFKTKWVRNSDNFWQIRCIIVRLLFRFHHKNVGSGNVLIEKMLKFPFFYLLISNPKLNVASVIKYELTGITHITKPIHNFYDHSCKFK